MKDYNESYSENNTYTYVLTNAGSYSNVTENVGTLSIDKRSVTLTSESGEKPYDGTPLTKPDVTVGGDGFVEGEATDIKATGSVTTVAEGEVTNTIVYTEGTNFKADNYTITKSEGTLKITASTKAVVIESSTKSWTYDGETHKDEVYTVTYGGTAATADSTGKVFTLSTGDTVTITATAEGVKDYNESYSKNNTYTYVLTNESSYSSVTANVGTLSIDKRTVTMTSADDQKVYDSTALTNDTVTESGDDFATGEGATYDVTGTQTLVGSSENTFTYTLNSNTKAANYTITTVFGTLTVTDGTNPPDEPVDPELVVTKTAEDKTYKLGEEVTFKITATNIYEKAQTITLTEIDGVTLAQSEFKNVKGGDTIETTATYTITETDILKGSFTNTVTAKMGKIEKEAEATVTTEEPNPSLDVEKETTSTPKNGKTYALGETIEYKITVTNDGNLTVKNIVVKDEMTGDEWNIESLAPGESKEFTTDHVVTEEDILAGKVVNDATADGDNDSDIPTDPDDDTTEDPTDPVDTSLDVKKTSDKDGKQVALGEVINYTITVKNIGNVTYKNVKVTDELTGDEWTIPELKVGETKTFNASYTVTETDILRGEVLNSVTAKGDPIPDPDPDEPDKVPEGDDDNKVPTEEPNPKFTLTKTVTNIPSRGYFDEGETAEFDIVVKNTGNLTLKNIEVTEKLEGAEFVAGDGYTIKDGKAVIAELAVGASVTVKAKYTVKKEDLGEDLKNVVTGTGEGPEDPDDPDKNHDPDPEEGETPVPVKNEFTLTIYYLYREDGSTAAKTYTKSGLKKGDAYNVKSPTIEGYIADQLRVKGTMPNEDVTVTVYYDLGEYTLTIYYRYVGGGTAAPTYKKTGLNIGDSYSVKSPVIDGYTCDRPTVRGKMPGRNVTITVYYAGEDIIIDDYGTPLGLGNLSLNAGDTIE